MPKIVTKPDKLNELNAGFDQAPLAEPVFLNSVPKCGTHLLRNIVRMFVPVEQQYHDAFIQHSLLREHQAAFSSVPPFLSWGHMLFFDQSAIALHNVRHILQIRDPYDWVLARTRFFLSDNFQGKLENLKAGSVEVDEVINMMIFGVYDKAPSLNDIFTHNAVAWLGTKATIIRYEDLLHHVVNLNAAAAEKYFEDLFGQCGISPLPEDWRERVRVGSDRKQSGTARENLSSSYADLIPDELSPTHKAMVDYASPGLRKILGYADD